MGVGGPCWYGGSSHGELREGRVRPRYVQIIAETTAALHAALPGSQTSVRRSHRSVEKHVCGCAMFRVKALSVSHRCLQRSVVTRARARRQVCVAWSPNNIDGRYYDIKVWKVPYYTASHTSPTTPFK